VLARDAVLAARLLERSRALPGGTAVDDLAVVPQPRGVALELGFVRLGGDPSLALERAVLARMRCCRR
jgi:hypothetical protein